MYKTIKLAFYNIINRNERLWLSPCHYWFSYFARQLRILCQVNYLADCACRYCHSWMEYALSRMPRPRTVSTQPSMGGLIFKFDKKCTNLECFIFQFEEAWSCVCGLSPPKPPVTTGLPRPLAIYNDGWSALWTKRLHYRKPTNATCCAESQFVPSAIFLLTP